MKDGSNRIQLSCLSKFNIGRGLSETGDHTSGRTGPTRGYGSFPFKDGCQMKGLLWTDCSLAEAGKTTSEIRAVRIAVDNLVNG